MRKEILAPMPGVIVKVLVNVGDTVREGDDVVILESMKMENQISAQVSGTVKEILVAAEDRVADQQTLIILA
ncbi:biotin/lipoyl-containing protein [Desulfoglaeba alkanexedens]|jgi:biotin carboxyl carrier protein|uniref:Biotin/lipoyl-binding protein n=1 Tax=Desulfoglaeba alkanexedens ALDC TaxID=980445 RepID=A0A4P8L4J9_9BACT|nr:biotin/lipoyl-containing protein [Desulfoglaeba alkanexedens]QCQ22907.1 biotin/lipoyl-binding protein [Desulfoglaeba alkanexedens ALDC]